MSGLLKRKEEVFFFVEVSMIVSENSLVILRLNKRKILRALLIILMMNECMNEWLVYYFHRFLGMGSWFWTIVTKHGVNNDCLVNQGSRFVWSKAFGKLSVRHCPLESWTSLTVSRLCQFTCQATAPSKSSTLSEIFVSTLTRKAPRWPILRDHRSRLAIVLKVLKGVLGSLTLVKEKMLTPKARRSSIPLRESTTKWGSRTTLTRKEPRGSILLNLSYLKQTLRLGWGVLHTRFFFSLQSLLLPKILRHRVRVSDQQVNKQNMHELAKKAIYTEK